MPLAIAGCSNSKPQPAQKPAEKPPEATPIKTGAVEITARRDRSKTDTTKVVAWVIRAKTADASLSLGGEGVGPTKLHGIEGDVYTEDGLVGSRFSADEGFADPTTRKLEISGHVRVVSLPNNDQRLNLVLTADQIKWMDDRGLIAAEGNVKVQTDVWTMGPSGVQWATPDLATMGSPDQFP
jgi:hypothetical protein